MRQIQIEDKAVSSRTQHFWRVASARPRVVFDAMQERFGDAKSRASGSRARDAQRTDKPGVCNGERFVP